MSFTDLIFWVYIVLLLLGGLFGFYQGKSKISLITSAVAAALLVLTTLRSVFQPAFARDLANVVMVILLVVFAIRLAKTKKFMPGGLMLLVTVAVLALRNVRF
ncbi:MAG TPA: TMEM14 family protein [Candidatus Sulfopaludibacter sp.]|nr:TMEM14 family protein [Candidatus Sulfopaludibacter sp.]